MLYRAVIFDLFQTLVPFSQAAHGRVLAEMALTLGLPPPSFVAAWPAAYNDLELGATTCEGLLGRVSRALGRRPTPDQLAAATAQYQVFQRGLLDPAPMVVATLAGIRQAGAAIGLISNCPAVVADIWPTARLAPLIDVAVFSARVGMLKPDPRIYRLACERLGVTPPDCLYVGDGTGGELSGAAAIGCDVVQLVVPDETPEEAQAFRREAWPGPRATTIAEILARLRAA